jgi:hypothetical protein
MLLKGQQGMEYISRHLHTPLFLSKPEIFDLGNVVSVGSPGCEKSQQTSSAIVNR